MYKQDQQSKSTHYHFSKPGFPPSRRSLAKQESGTLSQHELRRIIAEMLG
jgi:hypothetical protein